MIKKFTILSLLVISIMGCNKDACFECKKSDSTRGICGETQETLKGIWRSRATVIDFSDYL